MVEFDSASVVCVVSLRGRGSGPIHFKVHGGHLELCPEVVHPFASCVVWVIL